MDSANSTEEALTRLLRTELAQAQADAPALVEQFDPGRVWLLWFSVGALKTSWSLMAEPLSHRAD